MSWLKIEQVAQETGLTKRTIRYYEEMGLLASPQRSEKGTRLYTEEDIESLRRIMDAKEVLGISLVDLQQFVAFHDLLESYRNNYKGRAEVPGRKEKLIELEQKLGEQLEALDRKLEKMTSFRAELEDMRQRSRDVLGQLESQES
ncbi:MerR family transcriptional regulator [Paenibacillus agri]|uniref:MerR family transcriptional regulator n=1 Tax=Paenibacillus agri TaxID=2744309 RepID=A0A850ECY7_9BACL|nr:MerR family transcriptional regulator [Paenibacillus agri]NUU59113.1 MerR family transcriptional regulator [Paenibacillus agri]